MSSSHLCKRLTTSGSFWFERAVRTRDSVTEREHLWRASEDHAVDYITCPLLVKSTTSERFAGTQKHFAFTETHGYYRIWVHVVCRHKNGTWFPRNFVEMLNEWPQQWWHYLGESVTSCSVSCWMQKNYMWTQDGENCSRTCCASVAALKEIEFVFTSRL